MVKRKSRSAGEGAGSCASLPPPPDSLSEIVTLIAWTAHTPMNRIHLDKYDATEFNPGIKGDARFSPMKDSASQPVPTLYAGSNFDCAAMETVFHDVPYTRGSKSFARNLLDEHVHSVVMCSHDLLLVDLRSKALRKLGVQRGQIIDTEKSCYAGTRAWSEAIHAQCSDAQGIVWTSRQDDSQTACMLFGDRVIEGSLTQVGDSRRLTGDVDALSELLDLADQIGVNLV